jgi:hypothetical protein
MTDNLSHIGDRLRKEGEDLSFSSVVSGWREVLSLAPEQGEHTNVEALLSGLPPGDVIEFGCWRGELAEKCLSRRSDITSWVGYDILPELEVRCADPRFSFRVLEDWIFSIPTDVETVVAAHILEHMPESHLSKFFTNVSARNIFVEVPTAKSGPVSRADDCTHILELSWDEIISLAEEHGYRVKSEGATRIGYSGYPWYWAWLERRA